MSEFSQRLKKYITNSKTNIYKISNQSGLDYTTLQKMLKGSRLCGKEFLLELCRYLRINKVEEEELLELYNIEKVGKDRYYVRKEIYSLLSDIPKIKSDMQVNGSEYAVFSGEADVRYKEQKTINFTQKGDIFTFIRLMLADEVRNQEQPQVWFDSFAECEEVFKCLHREEKITGKQIKCNQLLHFYRGENGEEMSIDNIKLLHGILPYVFSSKSNCNIRYAYVSGNRRDHLFALWPHYVMSSDGVLLMSEGLTSAMYIGDRKIVDGYHDQIQKLMEEYHEVFSYRGFGEEALGYYINEIMNEFPKISVNGSPCVQWLLTPEIIESEKQNLILQKFRQYYVDIMQATKAKGDRYGFFQTNELDQFYETGILPGVFGNYLRKCTVEERKQMLYHVMDTDSEEYWNKYLFKDGYVNLEGIVIELYEKQQNMLISFVSKENFMIISIKESGIYEAFQDYFMSLKDSELVYDLEQSKVEYTNRINQMIK